MTVQVFSDSVSTDQPPPFVAAAETVGERLNAASTSVSAFGNLVLSGNSSITALATVAVSAVAVYGAIISITNTGTVTAKGYKQGEEWTTVSAGTDTWLQQG